MADFYTVVVEGNLVSAIERASAPGAGPLARTPLEAGTQLAENNRRRGSIDGRYCFDDAQRARVFAQLCLEFTRALAERRLAALGRLPAGRAEYRAGDEPAAPPAPQGAAP